MMHGNLIRPVRIAPPQRPCHALGQVARIGKYESRAAVGHLTFEPVEQRPEEAGAELFERFNHEIKRRVVGNLGDDARPVAPDQETRGGMTGAQVADSPMRCTPKRESVSSRSVLIDRSAPACWQRANALRPQ